MISRYNYALNTSIIQVLSESKIETAALDLSFTFRQWESSFVLFGQIIFRSRSLTNWKCVFGSLTQCETSKSKSKPYSANHYKSWPQVGQVTASILYSYLPIITNKLASIYYLYICITCANIPSKSLFISLAPIVGRSNFCTFALYTRFPLSILLRV